MGRGDELTTFLFARPSFVNGAARALDVGNTLSEYNHSRTGEEADAKAIRADLRAVGADFHRAVNDDSIRKAAKRARVRRRSQR